MKPIFYNIMKKSHIIFYLLNIFVIQLHARSIEKENKENVFDIISTNFTKCPLLANNTLTNTSMSFWSTCKDVSLVNPPERLGFQNTNEFYCIGMLAADMHLCKVINNDYKSLPGSVDELETYINVLRNVSVDIICATLKNITLFNDKTIQPSLLKTVTVLKQKLSGPQCSVLCFDLNNEGKTNELCSMLYLIHYHINNITNIKHSEKKIEISVADIKHVETDTNTRKQLIESTSENKTKTSDHNTDVISKVNPNTTILQSVTITERKGAKIIVPPTLPKDTNQENNNQMSLKNNQANPETSQSNLETKDEIPKTIKSTGTDDGPKDEIIIDENIPATTTENIKTNVDNIEYDNIDDTLKLPDDDENPVVVKVQEDLTNNKISSISKEKHYDDVEESNFFSYFMFISVMFIAGYVVYHNKQKIMALVLEGRRDRTSRRRPSTSSYRKLNSNLEEAVTSKCSGSASHVIY